jgi:hypothetical protein
MSHLLSAKRKRNDILPFPMVEQKIVDIEQLAISEEISSLPLL